MREFHLMHFPPNEVWPHGGWSVYCVSADELAQSIRFDAGGKVVERHTWPGYLGSFTTLAEATAAIEAAERLVDHS